MIALGFFHSFLLKEDVVEPSKEDRGVGDLVYTLSHVAAAPPPYPVNTTCYPPPLPRYPSCKGETGLTGKRLPKPRKVILMILFAFEVDTLEIALREQMDLLDKIFLVESVLTHKGVSEAV